ncbi:hypothetical protein [Lunatibacter salilacus]|uniref:hypothetical protein n=1 Tax=Lunatibacter salilacus TaxID=2483804 RepID=UPI00131C0AE0|nr:hypothetical protein [Lunatibacter salilacus]
MSDDEFDLLDELYFLQSFAYLKEVMDWEEERLLNTLQQLYDKEWIKPYTAPDEEIFEKTNLHISGQLYFYLATKKGLLSHNTI